MARVVNSIVKLLKGLIGLASTAVYVVFVPWRTNHDALHSLLNNPSQQDERMRTWREGKLGELNFVGIACALVAAVTASALAWPLGANLPWLTTALWYGGVMMSLTAISSATQQSLSLHRLNCYKDGLERLRSVLGRQSRHDPNKWAVRPVQLFVWQIPVMLLNFSIVMFVGGLIKLIHDRARADSWLISSSDTKIFLVVSVLAAFSLVNYVIGTSCLYYQTYTHFSN